MKKWVLLLLLAGCTLGPDYEPIAVCVPTEYEEIPEKTEEIDLTAWWKQFDDSLLSEYIDEALCYNFDLAIAMRKIEEVRALYRIDRSLLYPQIQGNLVAARSRRSETLGSDIIENSSSSAEILPTDFSGPLVQYFFQLGVDASWELDFFGKNRRIEEAAYRDFEASQDSALDVQIILVADVAQSYIDIRSLQQQIETKKQQIERQKELLELAMSRYAAGLTSYREVTLARAELDTEEGALPPLEEELKQTIHGLAILLGQTPEKFCIGEGFIPKAKGIIPTNLPSDLLLRRPDIRQAEREVAAATARIGVAKAELFPSFSLLSSFGTQSNKLDQLFMWPSRFWTIGPSMVWNLFTGGRLLAQIEVTNERQKQAILAYEKSVNNALRDVEDRLVGYFKEGERLESFEERLDSTSLLRDLTFDQYKAGLISIDDVLNAEKDFFVAQQEMIQSEGTLMVQLVGLYKALGGGWSCCDLP